MIWTCCIAVLESGEVQRNIMWRTTLYILSQELSSSSMPTATDPSLAPLPDHSFMYNRLFHLFPPQNYIPQRLPPQPSLVAHKVWIVDCKHCGSFISNRCMKAVLLLRPNVPLYSSDALPTNCSAFTSNPEALKPPTSCRPPTSPSRTCECLTQTLCCHGCGTTIGYMIVVPCIRCTSSISANNRATNGHRFVFHSTEVVGSERHYVPNEPGVIPFESVPNSPPPPLQYSDPLSEIYSPEYLPTPPLDMTDLSPSSSPPPVADSSSSSPYLDHLTPASRTSEHLSSSPVYIDDASPRDPGNTGQVLTPPPSLTTTNSMFSFGMPAGQQTERPLQAGDVLHWHHLIQQGEIPGVSDDPRARKGHISRKSMVFGR
jgi:hypothetical protein